MNPNFVAVDDRFGFTDRYEVEWTIPLAFLIWKFSQLCLVRICLINLFRPRLNCGGLSLIVSCVLVVYYHQSRLLATYATNETSPTATANPSIINFAPVSWLTPSPCPSREKSQTTKAHKDSDSYGAPNCPERATLPGLVRAGWGRPHLGQLVTFGDTGRSCILG